MECEEELEVEESEVTKDGPDRLSVSGSSLLSAVYSPALYIPLLRNCLPRTLSSFRQVCIICSKQKCRSLRSQFRPYRWPSQAETGRQFRTRAVRCRRAI